MESARRGAQQPFTYPFAKGGPLDDQSYRFSVAPMMDWTDRHCRMLHRTLSARALLYTEMVTTGAPTSALSVVTVRPDVNQR